MQICGIAILNFQNLAVLGLCACSGESVSCNDIYIKLTKGF